MKMISQSVLIILLTLGLVAELSAQSVAAFSSIKGDVTIKSAGKTSKARSNSKLKNGDRIKAGNNGKAVIIYYSGKEVVLRNNGSHTIRSNKSKKKGSQASGLGKVVSDLLWGKEKSKSVAGTTRWQTSDDDTTLMVIYPRRSKILETQPIFRWTDTKNNGPYTITIKSDVSDFSYIAKVNGTWFAYPANAPALDSEDQYTWQVDDSTGRTSTETYFSILADNERVYLKKDRLEVEQLETADGEAVEIDFLLSALYYRNNLFHLALANAEQAAISHPEMPTVYTLLETIHIRLGNEADAAINARQFAKMSVED